jgi:hypothetical protein
MDFLGGELKGGGQFRHLDVDGTISRTDMKVTGCEHVDWIQLALDLLEDIVSMVLICRFQ